MLFLFCCYPLSGHTACISALLGSGAEVNAADKQQCTALHSAAAGGQAHAAKTLMEAGAQVRGEGVGEDREGRRERVREGGEGEREEGRTGREGGEDREGGGEDREGRRERVREGGEGWSRGGRRERV